MQPPHLPPHPAPPAQEIRVSSSPASQDYTQILRVKSDGTRDPVDSGSIWETVSETKIESFDPERGEIARWFFH